MRGNNTKEAPACNAHKCFCLSELSSPPGPIFWPCLSLTNHSSRLLRLLKDSSCNFVNFWQKVNSSHIHCYKVNESPFSTKIWAAVLIYYEYSISSSNWISLDRTFRHGMGVSTIYSLYQKPSDSTANQRLSYDVWPLPYYQVACFIPWTRWSCCTSSFM